MNVTFRKISLLKCSHSFRSKQRDIGVNHIFQLSLAFHRSSIDSSVEMATTNADIKRYDNIIKGKLDKRSYRGLQLTNGLKTLLISDPSTDKSAASLTVNVGALSDYKDLPGLAHFLEHMLFLGSKKYPDENGYHKFVAEHAGHTNAYTTEHQTNFYFDIGPDHLTQALDRFAQFFLEPLFEESATEREVNAVNSEHEKNVPVDQWRIRQIEKAMSKAGHPYSSFSTGNKETLNIIPLAKGIDVREQLLKFHNTYYSANIMCLAILGKETLDDLESIVLNLFDDVNDKKINRIIYEDHPYGPNELKRKFYIVPVKDIRSLKISFSAPDITHQYKTAPEHYLGQLIGHEGPGSLHSLLREKGFCNRLCAGLNNIAPGFGFFTVSVDLTEEALNHVDEIITLLFQYIKLVKSEGIQKWIFDEISKLDEISFMFKDKESPASYVTTLSAAIDDYPFENILSANYIVDEWKPKLIEEFLTYLQPENMKVVVVSKSFEKIADQTEKWYGTKYFIEPLADELIKKLSNVELSAELKLPPPNEFIPENFDLYPLDEKAPKHPFVIQETPLSRIWFKQDDEFKLPKLVLKLEIFSSVAYLDPINTNLTAIFVHLLKDSLNEYAYAAELAGLRWDINNNKNGIILVLSGFNEKLPVLLDKVISRISNFKIDPKRFEIMKELFVRSLKNFETEQPHQHASFFLSYLLTECGWTKEELLSACSFLELPKLEKFLPDLFLGTYIQGLIHGNCNQNKALEIVNIFEAPFKSAISLLPQQLLPYREIKIENGSHYVYEVFNKYHSSSCLCAYFQCSLESTLNNTIIELFSQIIQEPCFDVLRTKEQLGYIVMSGIRRVSGVQGVIILVQSERHPVYLNSRVEEFLKSVKSLIAKMTDAEFEVHKTALETRKLEKPKQLSKLTARYWMEITSRYYNFDRVDLEVKELKTLQKKHILSFYDELLNQYSSKRRKLSIHVISKVTNPENPDDKNTETRIDDVTVFKNSLSLCPLPQSYISITPVGTKSKL